MDSNKKTTERVAAEVVADGFQIYPSVVFLYFGFQYHANLYGSQTRLFSIKSTSKFQYHANLYGSQTRQLLPSAWSSTLAFFPQIPAEPLEVLASDGL